MRTFVLAIALAAAAGPAAAQSHEILGYAGILGEWELAGTVTQKGRSFAGPVKMTHVGSCTQDGPEVRDGELRFELSGLSSSRIKATLLIGGVECSYSGRLADSYSGMMTCPDKRAVPLKIWLK